MSGGFSWDLVADLRDMWSAAFMVNAFRAGLIVAVLAATIGWFMVLRRQTFAGHTLAIAGFPGAAGAVWLGAGLTYGYYTFCLAAALAIATLPRRGEGGYAEQSAAIATVQAFALAAGMLFVSLYKGFLGGTNALLFGSVLGITTDQVNTLALVAALVLAVLAILGRPLLFASIDPEVAAAHGVPTRVLDTAFLVLLGLTVAEISQITGSLLVFALLVLPAATARQLTARPAAGLALSVALAAVTVFIALFIAYYSPYPVGFWLTTLAFGLYVTASATTATRTRLGQRTTRPPSALAPAGA
ncbi:metal ABC transporter permease [Pseudofrankia sp. DC12]|uniref:metal ABC transporter permease n=1 Tax=Pseudofrankia sp. DC12 TaxID=683315 RepID=UPI0005F7AE5D|nr:metal ABC transporter permease [Pseudofrankia sp. DC12]